MMPCDCQGFEETVYPQLPDKIKANTLKVCDYMKPMRNSITGKFICHYKPDKGGDGQTGEKTWPSLNLPGKEESTWIINH